MEAHDYNGEHQPDLKLLVQSYEEMLRDGGISFLEIDSFLMLTEYYEEQSNFHLALDVLVHAIQQHPYSASLYVRKAQLLSEQEHYDAAFDALDTAMIYEPSDLDIYLTQADIYMRLFDQKNALKVLDTALSYASDEDLADLYVLKSTIYETKNDHPRALEYLKKSLRKDPKNDTALSRIWYIYDSLKDYTDAIKFHQVFIDNNPYSYWAWYNLGLAYMYMGLIEKAIEAFDYSIVINENFEPAYHCYIDCLIGLEEYDTAMRYLGEYQELFRADAETWFRLGRCYEHYKEYKKARGYYTQALEINNLAGRVYHRLGHCYVEESLWDLAEKAFLQAYKIDVGNEEFCLSLADLYDAVDNIDKAHDFYHKAISIAPKEVEIWIHYVEFLIDHENYTLAIELLSEAKEYSDDVLLDYALAAVLIQSGRRQEGFIVLGQALLDAYEMHRYLYQIAPTLEKDLTITNFILRYKEE